jgi:hypothetical protein
VEQQTRISVANVVTTSAGTVLACALTLSASLAVANPNTGNGYTGPNFGGDHGAALMDLPMTPPVLGGDPTPPNQEPPVTIPTEEDTDDGDDPRDTPPPTFFGEEIDAEKDSIIYVIDQSGSMSLSIDPFEDQNGEIVTSGNRLDRAKAELKRSIGALPETFYFNVVFYDECVSSCWSAKQQATTANKQAAFSWIDAIQPDGWTNTGLAVQSALTDKDNKAIVLLSDGSPNFVDCAMNYVGSFDTHKSMIRGENTQNAVVNTFGIGISNDNDARTFMQQVASENGGSYVEIN